MYVRQDGSFMSLSTKAASPGTASRSTSLRVVATIIQIAPVSAALLICMAIVLQPPRYVLA
jgi:hypothetical protein